MWPSFWITVGFGILYVMVEVLLDHPLPYGTGLLSAAATSILTNGWSSFWNWTETHRIGCVETSSGVRNCFITPLVDVEPPGWVGVVMPWYENGFWGWVFASLPIDFAASALSGAIVWVAFRAFGYHTLVEKHVNPLA
jgi:hypothetical protein